ncbi:aromatic amino acid lyase [Myxococcota bacterium]|nr:aromatic amino acid lyase [Myxococcota bacterium]MCZ7616906.1 aromatic amino acid lyase [Myxococcota bacterium]
MSAAAAEPKSATPEGATPEGATPEAATPEAATPETATPEATARESAAGGADLLLGTRPLTIADVLALAHGRRRASLSDDPAQRRKLARSRAVVDEIQRRREPIYGVTTGVGASAGTAIPESLRDEMPHNLLRFHGCGTGRILDETEAAAVLTVRLATLARGYSGVRPLLLERLCELLNARVLPRIPEEGSVGASGDLTPLSYLAALVVGEREATVRGRVLRADEALAAAGLEPLALERKESLSLMNGTSVMTALACLCFERAERLARLAAAVTAMIVEATHGNPAHFDARLFALKPHPGQTRCAAWIRADLAADGVPPAPARLQDRYSLRCAPHVIGVLLDALVQARPTLEIEINGVDDNPIIDPDRREVLHGGNFYGGHVAFVMDGLKTAVANVADLLDRQLVLLCVPDTSDGLPANLVAADNPAHHGFKAMQITASALTAEALKGTMPASVFSRSTESHNQDKVSMGTIAARDCRRILDLTETVAVIGLLAACQALDLRGTEPVARRGRALRDAVRKHASMVTEDRRQDLDIERVLGLYRDGALPIGALDAPSEE